MQKPRIELKPKFLLILFWSLQFIRTFTSFYALIIPFNKSTHWLQITVKIDWGFSFSQLLTFCDFILQLILKKLYVSIILGKYINNLGREVTTVQKTAKK